MCSDSMNKNCWTARAASTPEGAAERWNMRAPIAPEMAGTHPVVLYFGSAKDADEFTAAVALERGFTARKLE